MHLGTKSFKFHIPTFLHINIWLSRYFTVTFGNTKQKLNTFIKTILRINEINIKKIICFKFCRNKTNL